MKGDTRMKQLVFAALGDPLDVLRVHEAPIPAPSVGQVRIRVKACPINPSDDMFIRGEYCWRPSLPQVAGLEGAGVVEASGPGDRIPVKTPVCFRAMGTWAEFIVLPADAVTPLIESIPLESACQLSLNPPTAWALLHEAGLQSGDWLLLTGGASTVNLVVVQLARERGLRTICTVRSKEKLPTLKALGATEVIDTSAGDLAERVNDLTESRGVACCFDAVGGGIASVAYRCLAVKGRMFVYGRLSRDDFPLNNATIVYRNLTIRGFGIDDWLERAPAATKARMRQELTEKVRSSRLILPVAASYPLEKAHEAIRHARSSVTVGKVLLMA
jgi:NADPH:quinone reductase-like Zn-dependent oxidoreductase